MSPRKRLSVAVVIVTHGRPGTLDRALKSWGKCEPGPDEFVVVDSTPTAPQYMGELMAKNERLFHAERGHYLLSTRQSIPAQRNLALDVVDTDLVSFADDDALPSLDYLEKVVEVFQADQQGRLGGLEGGDPRGVMFSYRLAQSGRELARRFVRRLRIPPSVGGSLQLPGELRDLPIRPARSLHGAKMTFPTHLARQLRFDEAMERYAYLEDFDFSFRVSRTHCLASRPDAFMAHLRAKEARPSEVQYFLSSWVNPAYLIEKLFPDDGSRRSLDRLLRLSELATSGRRLFSLGDGTVIGAAAFSLVRQMIGFLRHDDRGTLVDRFRLVQEKIYSMTGLADVKPCQVQVPWPGPTESNDSWPLLRSPSYQGGGKAGQEGTGRGQGSSA